MAEHALANLHNDNGAHGRKAERFAVSRAARILSINPALSGISIRSCHLVDISRIGATADLMTTVGLPDHYYLNIIGTANRIGCAEIYRNGSRVGLKFIKEIDDELLHTIVRGDFFTKAI
ncbi:MAG: PilZ domain-containing protein [Rhizobiaceae bacterium]|nr:PilZ domain-containing protein [Rhizobiaceae bacterium]